MIVIPIVMMITTCMAGVGLFQFSEDTKIIKLGDSLIRASERVRIDLIDAETGQRGFIITADNQYLDIYTASVRDYQMDSVTLSVLASTNPQDVAVVQNLSALASSKLVEMARTIEIRQTAGFEATQKIIATQVGKTIMDEIRVVSANFERLQQDRVTNAQSINDRFAALTVISLIFSVICLFVWMMPQQRNET
jgi:CHASE3 domain sensor protein